MAFRTKTQAMKRSAPRVIRKCSCGNPLMT